MNGKIPHIERPNIEDYSGPAQNTAKNALRITTEGRTFLPDVIPLSTPYLVFLDPSDLCNAKCRFCPTGTGEIKKYRKQQLMDFVLYRKIIDDLCAMPEPIKTLRLYCFGEPLLNPIFTEMVKYAKKTRRFGQIDTTTNGLLLTPQMSDGLIDAGLNKLFVSVPADYTAEYFNGVNYFFQESRGRCKVFVKILGDSLSEYKKDVFKHFFGKVSDELAIEYLSPCWPDFKVEAGQKGIYGQELPEKAPNVCPYLFYSLAINADGKVSACFLDWRKAMVIGDLKQESFKDIWNGSKLRGLQLAHLMGYRCQIKHCKDCGQLRYGMPDNIDAYAEQILERMLEK